MKSHVHLVVPDLFLPREIVVEACAGLRLPALEKLLARAQPEPLAAESLEVWLCEAFGVKRQGIAPITLLADGVEAGAAYWLRADPVHWDIQRDQLVLREDIGPSADEATQLCARLNAHFAADGLHFIAPHPQRWYLRLDASPALTTTILAKTVGRNVHAHLPQGIDALHWHRVMNEAQMLLFGHPVNQIREGRGELPVNSIWLWGGGHMPERLTGIFDVAYSNSFLVAAFAQVAGISHAALPNDAMQCAAGDEGNVLVVWDGLTCAIRRGDFGMWCASLRDFEQHCVAPLLGALRAGKIGRVTLDVLQADTARRFVLTRGMTWKVWQLARQLEHYSAQ